MLSKTKSMWTLGAIVTALSLAGSASADPTPRPIVDHRDHRVTRDHRNTDHCSLTFREGVLFTDARGQQSLDCRLAITDHNRKVVAKRVASSVGVAKFIAQGELKQWEKTYHNIAVAEAEEDVEQAKQAAARAPAGPQKLGAAARVASAQADLNKVLDAAERYTDEMADDAREKLTERLGAAKRRAAEAKQKFLGASANVKDELEAKYVALEQAAQRMEGIVAKADLAQAQRKLNAAKERVGNEAEALKAKAQQKVDAAKAKADALKAKAKAEVERLAARAKQLKAKLKNAVNDVKDDIDDLDDDIKDQVQDAKRGIKSEVKNVVGDVKDIFRF